MKNHGVVPILIIAFNRPQKVHDLIQALRLVQPTKIFVSLDGPRKHVASDQVLQQKVLQELQNIDWKCKVKVRQSPENVGCKIGVSSAIDWFFTQVDAGIILEDDCIPNKSFFQFCDELLNKYKDDTKVMSIAGSNTVSDHLTQDSYFFTSTPVCWGWATWKRAWKYFDVQMKDWPTFKQQQLSKRFKRPEQVRYWANLFDKTYKNQIDTWDYQWVFAVVKNNGLCINPKVNLITNTGFDNDATHTKFAHFQHAFRPNKNITFPLVHPAQVKINAVADSSIQRVLYQQKQWKYYSLLFLGTLRYRVHKIFRRLQ